MTSPPHKPARGLTSRALGGMFWTLSGTGVQAVVQLVAIMALGRLLTPTEFGLMAAAGVVVAFSQIVSQIGVGPAIIQRKVLSPVHVRVAVTVSVVLGTLLGGIVFFGAPVIARLYHIPEVEPILRAVAFLFPLDGLNTVARSLLTRQLRFRLFMALDVGSYIVGYSVVGVILAWQGFGVWSLVIANLAQQLLRTVSMYVATRHDLRPSLDLRAGKGLLSFGAGHSMAQIGTLLSQQGDNMVVGRWLGPAALGVYGRAYSLLVLPATQFGRIVNRVLFPVMAQVQHERHRLVKAYERGVAVVALLSLPISAFLMVVAPEFIPIVLGPKWGAVVLPFRLFSISLLFRMGSKISTACIKATGQVYALAVFQFVYAGLVVAGAIVGQRWGVGGVAVCVSVAMACDWLNTAYLGRSATGLPWSRFLAVHVPGLLLAAMVGAGAEAGAELARRIHLGNIMVIAVAGAGALLAAAGAAALAPQLFLGSHGTWAWREAGGLMRRSAGRTAPSASPAVEEMAGAGQGRAG